MDWLEIPQLRARALAWVGARLRGRPPRWSVLDREGRLIALYGILAVLWLAVAVNLAVPGLVRPRRRAGHRPAGPPVFGGILLLVLVVLGLARAGRSASCSAGVDRWWRRLRRRSAEKDREADIPRRLAALRASDLGGLPEPALHGLAARARWVHAPTGPAGGPRRRLAVRRLRGGRGRAAGAASRGDPAGTIRHHVGPGGVVGLVNALTGRPTELDWHTAGTTLLAIPTATVATVVGPLPGPPPQDRTEAEALFADTPALAGLGRRPAARADRLGPPGRPRPPARR